MWLFLRRLGPYLKDYRERIAMSFIGGAVGAAAYGAVMYLIRDVINEIFIAKDETILQVLPPMIVGLFLIVGAGRYLQVYELNWVGLDVVRRLRDRLLAHLLDLDMAFFGRFHGGELISRVTNDIARIRQAVTQQLSVVIRESLAAIAFVVVVITMSPKLAFWTLVALPLAAWPLAALARRFKRIMHRSQEKDSDITSRLAEIFNNMEIIKAHAAEAFELARFERDNLEFRRINMRGVRTRELTNPLMEFLGAIAAAGVIWIGGLEVISDRMDAGEFFAFSVALFSLYNPIKRISQASNQMYEAVAASERIFDLLERRPSITGGGRRLAGPITSVELDDVHLAYGQVEALRGVSVSVGAGETVALVGDSGGGKSSLVSLIPRLWDPTAGVVRVNGVDARELDLAELRGRIGLVTQRVYIFNDTVAANVAYGVDLDRERIEAALRRAGAWDFVGGMSDGIDTVLSEFGSNLSGGQRQRLAIARAIYRDPDVLILDEATSALDNRSEAAVQRALADLIRDRITLIIAHRLSTVDLAGSILVLKGGRIVGAGTKAELLRDCEEYRRLVSAGLDGEPPATEAGDL
ncbi:MAG: ABC transporter ATP-binding protein/permease [Thermoanaerobaculales bacterium]|jgi:subfamily B ATP-binding cassette protein MsbA|nr:ABC transporter ATP-binding protein/permease [Thermoanaerobaculales bacterium]